MENNPTSHSSFLCVKIIIEKYRRGKCDGITLPAEDKAVNRINKLRREELLDDDMASLFHALRKVRNQAGHEGYESVAEAKNYPKRRKTPNFSYGDIRRVHRIYVSN